MRTPPITLRSILKLLLTSILALSMTTHAAELNKAAPSCQIASATPTNNFDPTKYQGQVVLLDFWATWCPPCLKSMPFFNQLQERYRGLPFTVISINVDEETETAHRFLNGHPLNYPVIFDPQGSCPSQFALPGMPTTYILDKNGVIKKIHVGYRDEDQPQIIESINNLLN